MNTCAHKFPKQFQVKLLRQFEMWLISKPFTKLSGRFFNEMKPLQILSGFFLFRSQPKLAGFNHTKWSQPIYIFHNRLPFWWFLLFLQCYWFLLVLLRVKSCVIDLLILNWIERFSSFFCSKWIRMTHKFAMQLQNIFHK